MKKPLLVAAMLAFAGTQIQTANANDRGWATAGKVLTGVAIGSVIASAVDAHASYSVTYSSAPVYCAPPGPVIVTSPRIVYAPPAYALPRVIVAPAPVVCVPRPIVVYRPPAVCAPPVVYVRYDRYASRGRDRYDRHDRHDHDGRRGHR